MSHFAVAVFMTDNKQSLENLLLPYRETPENFDPKWDWYRIGGRWQGELLLKDNKKGKRGKPGLLMEMSDGYDAAFASDIDFTAMYKRDKTFHTYAVITPDGKWHAPGEIWWFGFSSSSKRAERKWRRGYYEHFIEPAIKNNWYMVIVDCHI